MKNYHTLPEAMSDLKKKGYDADFETSSFCLYCSDLDMRLNPGAFHVDEVDHIEEDANPAGSPTVYAISSSTGVKGTIVDTEQSLSQ